MIRIACVECGVKFFPAAEPEERCPSCARPAFPECVRPGNHDLAILNTTILTADGDYSLRAISLQEAKWLIVLYGQGDNLLSAVGHAATAQILTDLLGVPVPVNRILFEQKAGQQALCFKLNGRPPEGAILSREELEEIGYSFKVLTRH